MARTKTREITVQSEAVRSLSATAVHRLGRLDLAQTIDAREIPFQLSPWENKLVVDGLRDIITERWYPEYEKARARGLLASSGWKY